MSNECDIKEIQLKIDGEKDTHLKVYHFVPKHLEIEKEKTKLYPAVVYAHPSNGLFFSAEMFTSEACFIAMTLGCPVFSIDYRKAPQFEVPAMHKDFAQGISFVIENAEENHIDKKKICVMG